jgi:hypothetical protein
MKAKIFYVRFSSISISQNFVSLSMTVDSETALHLVVFTFLRKTYLRWFRRGRLRRLLDQLFILSSRDKRTETRQVNPHRITLSSSLYRQ